MEFGFEFSMLRVPCLMGIVNVTPNSFSDGGETFTPGDAAGRCQELLDAGATILDLGAEASSFFRAGVEPVEAEEQWRRLAPVLEGLQRNSPRRHGGAAFWVSVDTRSSEVARRAIGAGAAIVNDISAGEHDAEMLGTVAELNAGIVLMHIGSTYPENPATDDADIVATLRSYLGKRIEAAMSAGIKKERIAVDPGMGFGKTMRDNWTLATRAHELRDLGVPVVLGASRKRFLESEAPAEVAGILVGLKGAGGHDRDAASAALTAIAARQGVEIHRVHNVALAARALRM